MAHSSKSTRRSVRRSISLATELDSKVQKLARNQNWSSNQAIEELVRLGLVAKEAEKRRFFELAERLRETSDNKEAETLKAELARMTFGA